MDSPKLEQSRRKSIQTSENEQDEDVSKTKTEEVNGENETEKMALDDDSTVSTTEIVSSEEVEISTSNKELDKDNNSSEDVDNMSEENVESVSNDSTLSKKSVKRKASEANLDDSIDTEPLNDSTEDGNEVIEGELASDIKIEHDDSANDSSASASDLSLPQKQTLGKGKRARIPNKRYSDIAISTPPKVSRPSIENGNKMVDTIEKEELLLSKPVLKAVLKPLSTPVKEVKDIKEIKENYLKPFKYGWRRELVWRATTSGKNSHQGDIYYYTPAGKKVRSMRELSEHLTDRELSLDDFTFGIKAALGVNDPAKEIIRQAYKVGGSAPKSGSPKTVSSPKPEPKSLKPIATLKPTKIVTTSPKPLKVSTRVKTAPARAPAKVKIEVKADKRKSGGNFKVKLPPTKTKVVKTESATSPPKSPMAGKKTIAKKNTRWGQRSVSRESVGVKRRKTGELNNSTTAPSFEEREETKAETSLQNLCYGYNALLYIFHHLKVQDLLRASCVCTMWRDIASHPMLWRTVRMKNSQVHSFEGLSNSLKKHGTVHLDLRKMLLTNSDEIWSDFSNNIGKVETLRKIELCRCPSAVVEKLAETNPKLEVINAVTIRCDSMDLTGLEKLNDLTELRLRSTVGLTLPTDIESFKTLTGLKVLSLTSIRDLNKLKLDVIAELTRLESLDLGECTEFPETFGERILAKLTNLEKLRLEKGQGNCNTFEILNAVKGMSKLEQLELVNFDIKIGFDKVLGACKNIKKFLIIPTYISQSATTNYMVLGGVLRLRNTLSHFVWGVTLELLRVTDLFVDQCEEPEKKSKKETQQVGNGDSIPVLKPVPNITDSKSDIAAPFDPPEVEILPLPNLQKLLLQNLPTTRVKILKIPFHATWRQSITDSVN